MEQLLRAGLGHATDARPLWRPRRPQSGPRAVTSVPPVAERLPGDVSRDGMVLRLWRPADVPLLHEAIGANVEHLRPWMPWVALEPLVPAQRLALVQEWETNWAAGQAAPMAMWVDGTVVGGTGYVRPQGTTAWQIGYWVHVEHLGRGYATRAARLLTTAALELDWIDAIEIHHDKANVRSGRVPPRLGYRYMGERPDEVAAPGEVGIDCTWRMTREEWHGDEHR
jgi:ribosomal-protein-serine acetyltransferase